MKTHKQRTIAACENLIEMYPLGLVKHNWDDCPICKPYKSENNECFGCFMSEEDGRMGCIKFKSYNESDELIDPNHKSRIKFHQDAIKILEKIDPKYFTPKGLEYKAFDKIHKLY
jgi:hypothetical protein